MLNYFSVGKKQASSTGAAFLVVAALLLMTTESKAESGFYVGGSVGKAGIELDVTDTVSTFAFDEDDTAWKLIAGFNADLPVLNLGIEGGYVDLGSPSGDFAGTEIAVSTDGIDLFGVVGVDLGPIGVFAKAGMISWDAEGSIGGLTFSDDGSDPAYGVGARIGLSSVEIRLEYEMFDISDTQDVSMISAGITWNF